MSVSIRKKAKIKTVEMIIITIINAVIKTHTKCYFHLRTCKCPTKIRPRSRSIKGAQIKIVRCYLLLLTVNDL